MQHGLKERCFIEKNSSIYLDMIKQKRWRWSHKNRKAVAAAIFIAQIKPNLVQCRIHRQKHFVSELHSVSAMAERSKRAR